MKIDSYGLYFVLNGTSNEYGLHLVYNGNVFIGTITELHQVYLATYDTNAHPFVYTGSENIDITDNQIPLSFPIQINNEIVLNPRAYGNAVFEMISCIDNLNFRQNTIHGGQPIAQFFSSTKSCTFNGDCEIPNMYNKTSVDMVIADIYNDVQIKAGIDTLISNINSSNYYIKAEIDTLISNIDLSNYYIKAEIGTFFKYIYIYAVIILNPK